MEYSNMRIQLICTFVNRKYLDKCIDEIALKHDIIFNKIFIFESEDVPEYILSYNIDKDLKTDFVPNTVLVHRNKQTNTLYTINALNEVIKEANNGVVDKNYNVIWENYENMLMVTNDVELVKIKLSLKDKARIIQK